jgi:hypothetical protein
MLLKKVKYQAFLALLPCGVNAFSTNLRLVKYQRQKKHAAACFLLFLLNTCSIFRGTSDAPSSRQM